MLVASLLLVVGLLNSVGLILMAFIIRRHCATHDHEYCGKLLNIKSPTEETSRGFAGAGEAMMKGIEDARRQRDL